MVSLARPSTLTHCRAFAHPRPGAKLLSFNNTISNNWRGVNVGSGLFTDNGSVISASVDAGISVGAGSYSLEKSVVRGNRNRGIHMGPGGNGFITGSTIEGNTTSGDGAGMYIPADPNINGSSAFAIPPIPT